jgi:DNA-binding CsgD family transcriptional regulator
LILLSQGFLSAELAEKLTISAETLHTDLKSIYDKLHSRAH